MYPISYEADPELEGRNRLTTFFRYLVAIPWLIVASIYGFVAEIAAVIAWFAIVFTGKYPEGLYNFNAGYLRMISRVNGFEYLLTDGWPPFGGDDAPDYPIRVGVPAPLDEYDRLKTGLRLIIGIPVYLLAIVQAIILTVCSLIAWFAILFTGKLSEGLFNPIRSSAAYLTRAGGYFLLLTEDYPPFTYEEGGAAPAGQIPTQSETPGVPQ
ncbi:MAG TPA: DUF4389 domain-containing protein [Solirubrobacterales bacterium]|nr:DUF4389 domain-containing protein [Solirubrobacterales bacterium]